MCFLFFFIRFPGKLIDKFIYFVVKCIILQLFHLVYLSPVFGNCLYIYIFESITDVPKVIVYLY